LVRPHLPSSVLKHEAILFKAGEQVEQVAAAWPSIFILLAVSWLSGFIIGKSSFSWPALIVAGAVLATLGAVVFQGQGFTALPGIFTIVGGLVVNQVAYVLAIRPKR
jgi:hypothetical protein